MTRHYPALIFVLFLEFQVDPELKAEERSRTQEEGRETERKRRVEEGEEKILQEEDLDGKPD